MKIRRTLTWIFALLCVGLPALAAVNIPDAALKGKINGVLGKPATAEITQAEMESLTALELNNTTALQDLTGLETATNLTLLYISKTGVTDLSPLAGLTSLETLYLNNTGVSDISAVSGLTSLTDLSLNKTGVTDISAVSGLTKLVQLRLHGTDVSDISAVSGLTSLEVLYIHNTLVTWEGLTPVRSLRAEGNLTDIRYRVLTMTRDPSDDSFSSYFYLHPVELNVVSFGPIDVVEPDEIEWYKFMPDETITLTATSDGSGRTETASFLCKDAQVIWKGGIFLPEVGNWTVVISAEGVAPLTYQVTIHEKPNFEIIKGDGQAGRVGSQLPLDLGVKTTYVNGVGSGRPILWKVTSGGGTLSYPETTNTYLDTDGNTVPYGNAEGEVYATLTLGPEPGENIVTATIKSSKAHPLILTFTATAVATEDVDADGDVDIQDLLTVAQAFGNSSPGNADLDGDGEVTLADIRAVLTALENAAGAPARDTTESLRQWTHAAEQANQQHGYKWTRGIEVLQMLLESATVPKATGLGRNYPNPFNPETWIPYQLAKAADVTVSIYNTQGARVRTLALGHQAAGVYQHRTRAAYWDGKNAQGEPVASGVYFYTLTAGEFTATQKMVIRK